MSCGTCAERSEGKYYCSKDPKADQRLSENISVYLSYSGPEIPADALPPGDASGLKERNVVEWSYPADDPAAYLCYMKSVALSKH